MFIAHAAVAARSLDVMGLATREDLLGDPRGGDLQRDYHSAADPDRAQRGEVSPGRGRRAAAGNLLYWGLGA